MSEGKSQTTVATDPLPYGPIDRVATLRTAIWRAMMEIENDGAEVAYEILQHAWWESNR